MSEDSQPAELLREGIAAAKAGRKEEAREALLQVVKLDERSEQAWLWLSAVVDSDEERQICLENVLAVNPANTRAQAGLDWLRRSSPQPEAPLPEAALAEAPLTEALAPEPPQVEAPPLQEEPCPRCGAGIRATSSACPNCGLPLIVACPKCDEYVSVEETSCPHCGQALGDYRQGHAYHLELARLYFHHHSADRAQEALDRAEAEAGGDADVLAQVAGMYEEGGFRNRAIASYERAVEAAPRDPALHARLAAVYRQHGDRTRAGALLEKAEELGSQDPAVTCELARLDLEAGAAQKAVSRLQPLVRKQHVEPQAILLMGNALESLGDQDAAVAHYRRAVQLAPADTEAGREARAKLAHLGAVPVKPAPGSGRAVGERPGCVSLYALLAIAGGVVSLLGAVAVAAVYAGARPWFDQAFQQQGLAGFIDWNQVNPLLGIAFAFFVVAAVVGLGVGTGLWMRKNWARLAVVTFSTLSFVIALVLLTNVISTTRETTGGAVLDSLPLPVIVGLVVAFVIQAAIIFWFLVHREAFE